jgi:hypothetical protein
MASTGTVIATNADRAANHTYPELWADVSVNGGNPYVPGTGLAVTAASLETLLNTYGVYGIDVSSIDRVEDMLRGSTNGTYYCSWDGTGLLHFLNTTGVEAGAIDLSAAAGDVVARVYFTVTQ